MTAGNHQILVSQASQLLHASERSCCCPNSTLASRRDSVREDEAFLSSNSLDGPRLSTATSTGFASDAALRDRRKSKLYKAAIISGILLVAAVIATAIAVPLSICTLPSQPVDLS